MDASPLGRLPTEIRLSIYERVLVFDEPVQIGEAPIRDKDLLHIPHGYSYGTSECFERSKRPALGYTCRKIQREALPIFVSKNTFTIAVETPYCPEDAIYLAEARGLPFSPKSEFYEAELRRLQLLDSFLLFIHDFLVFAEGIELQPLKVEINIGDFLLGGGAQIHRLRSLLQQIAGKKPEGLKGGATCMTKFAVPSRSQLPTSFSVDAWNIRQSLPGVADALVAIGPHARAAVQLMRVWANAPWAT